jgi:hypothetical protein
MCSQSNSPMARRADGRAQFYERAFRTAVIPGLCKAQAGIPIAKDRHMCTINDVNDALLVTTGISFGVHDRGDAE